MKNIRPLRKMVDKAWDIASSHRKSVQEYRDMAAEEQKKGNTELAIAFYQQAVQIKPEDPESFGDLVNSYVDLGQLLYEKNDNDDAIECFDKALKCDENNLKALKGLGFAFQRRKKPTEAMYYYLKYLEHDETNFDVYFNLAALLYSMQKYEESIKYYEKSIVLNPKDIGAYHNLAIVYYYLGNFTSAIGTLKRAHSLGLENSQTLSLLGLILDVNGDKDGALENYKKAVELDPDNSGAYINMSRILSEKEKYPEALENAQHALDLIKKQENRVDMDIALGEIGWCYYCLGNLNQSIKFSKMALDIDSKLRFVRFNLALAFLCQGNIKQARKHYDEGIEDIENPTDIKVYAIDDLEKALRKNPDLAGGKEILVYLTEQYNSTKQPLSA